MKTPGGLGLLALLACATAASGGSVSVARDPGQSIVLRASAAELRLLPSGELQGALLDGKRGRSLQEPGGPGDVVAAPGRGRIEPRGQPPGRHRLRDSVEGADLGVVDAADPLLTTSSTHRLLLEAMPLP